MPRKRRHPLSLKDRAEALKNVGMRSACVVKKTVPDGDAAFHDIMTRVRSVLGVVDKAKRKAGNMLFFVMYDIESDKVRRLIVKYLQRKGCTRVQRSVFLADLPLKEYDNIRADLTEAQSAYDNDDSILVVPVSTDMMQAMRIIGKNIDIDLIMHSSNTLFLTMPRKFWQECNLWLTLYFWWRIYYCCLLAVIL